jgi:sialic acid synthase SpsE
MVEFIAEFTTNHMGNLNVLLRMVEEAKASGATYIKMQKKDVESFYSADKLDSKYDSPYGKTYRDYRTIFEFDDEDYDRFDRKCKEVGIEWFTTIQDIPSLHWMLKYDLDMYKVASCNATNTPLLSAIRDNVSTDKTIVISVAGLTIDEIRGIVEFFPEHNIRILHCVAEYPCPTNKLKLGNIYQLKNMFENDRVKIGYSGHEVGIEPSLAVLDIGVSMVERHFCLSRHSFVHHIGCSLTPDEFKLMVDTHNHVSPNGWGSTLPKEAFNVDFGMTDNEYNFLKRNEYAKDHIEYGSEFTK